MKKKNELNHADNPLYHNTWTLLKKYRDVVWSLELSVQQVRNTFEIEYGNAVEEFLDSIYLAGADLTGSAIEHHAQCIEQSHKMLKLLDTAIDLLRTKHKNGESFYWLLYYSFLSPSSFAMWTKLSKSCAHISVISASEPITGAEGKLSTH